MASTVNQDYDSHRWAVAAATAKQVIDMNYYELRTVAQDPQETSPWPIDNVPKAQFPEGAGGIDPIALLLKCSTAWRNLVQNNKEFIWAQPSEHVHSYTRHSFPVYYGG